MGAAGGARQGISLGNLPDQMSPRAAGLSGEIGIVPGIGRGSVDGRAIGLPVATDDSAPVGIGAIESLAVASGVGNMRCDPVNPFQWIEHHAAGAGARVRERLEGQVAVIEFIEGIHGQSGAGDVAALGFERGDRGGIDGRSGEDQESGMDPGRKIASCARREWGSTTARISARGAKAACASISPARANSLPRPSAAWLQSWRPGTKGKANPGLF